MARAPASAPAPAQDPRERYIDRNMSAWAAKLCPKAVEDLKYFAKRASEGRPITIVALQKWMLDNYQQKIGVHKLATIAREHGIEPWWRTRS